MPTVVSSDIDGVVSGITDFSDPAIVEGGSLVISDGVLVRSAGDRGIYSITVDSYDMTIAGTVQGHEEGISLRRNQAGAEMDYSVHIAATGSVLSDQNFAIEIFNDGGNTSVTGTISITNDGTIEAQREAAMFLGAADLVEITNSGTVTSHSTSTYLDNAIRVIGSDIVRMTNTGTIDAAASTTGTASGLVVNVAAVSVDAPGSFENSVLNFTNSGTLTGASHAFYSAMELTMLTNTGVINGTVQTDPIRGAVIIRNTNAINGNVFMGDSDFDATDDHMNNSGTVTGNVLMRNGADILINTGTITGDLDMGRGNDLLVAFGGTIGGEIELGQGNDTIRVDDAALVVTDDGGIDEVQSRVSWVLGRDFEDLILLGRDHIDGTGSLYDNYIAGNFGRNVLNGAGGNDELFGAGDNDTLMGDYGNDTLRGGGGSDLMQGGTGNDILSASWGEDTLEGGIGNDTLSGQNGNDVIIGGAGRDVMTGGNGRDTFVFEAVTDSSYAGSLADQILDFAAGTDRIDLSDLAQGLITFRATAGFTGSGAAEARAVVNGAGHTLLYLDTNGDARADSLIYLLNSSGLSADDLIL